LTLKTKAHLSVLFANLIFSINFSVVKFVTPGLIKPFGLNVVRVLITTSLFWLLALFEKDKGPIRKKDIGLFIFCGLTGVAINQLLFIKGISLTYSIHGALLMLCTPILITIIAFFILRERISLLRIIGLAIGISGAVMLISAKEKSGSGSNIILGDILIICNAIAYAFYFVYVKPLMFQYSPMKVIRWVFTFGTLFILPFGWTEFIEIPWMNFGWIDYIAIAFVVFAATFLAYLLTIYGLQHLDAGATGSYIYLQPVFAAIIAIIFLNEPLSIEKIIAALLIFAGVFLVNRK
jgi:drug/metabolite transporter (DMT)-like permease